MLIRESRLSPTNVLEATERNVRHCVHAWMPFVRPATAWDTAWARTWRRSWPSTRAMT